MKIAILGFGREGKSLIEFLGREPRYRRATFWILDKNPAVRRKARGARAHLRLGKNYRKNCSSFDFIFRSPGGPYQLPEIQRARKAGVVVSSATQLFFDRVPREKLIGITGTKGKGTTASLLAHILKRVGKRVVLAGNIGSPMLNAISAARRADFVILELSSFQLQDLAQSPRIAVVLDVFPDHLDAHKDLKEYYAAKANIGRFQNRRDLLFYFADNSRSRTIAMKSPAKKIAMYPNDKGVGKNVEMASAIAARLGVPKQTIQKAIATFRGLPHRLELICTIRIRQPQHSNILQNVRMLFYDDSAATNPEAAAAAIQSLKGSIILLAGGRGKGLDYRPLDRAIKTAKNVERVILFGENKHEIARVLPREKVVFAPTLAVALRTAYRFAKKLINFKTGKLITILLSPASASFDQFKSYVDRGEQFKKFVNAIRR